MDSTPDPCPELSTLNFPNSQRIKDHEPLAHISAVFVRELFKQGIEDIHEPFFPDHTYLPLPFFIAHALSKSPLDTSVALATLNLLYRYKTRIRHRQIKLRDPSRLYIAAYLVAGKAMSDHHPYPMQIWVGLAQNNYDTVELGDMEREFCVGLRWDLGIDDEVVDSFRIFGRACSIFLMVRETQVVGMGGLDDWGTDRGDWSHRTRSAEELSSVAFSTMGASGLSSMIEVVEDEWVNVQEELDGMEVEVEKDWRSILERYCRSSVPRGKSRKRKRLSGLFSLLKRRTVVES